ncbi:tetratricopeptide repeat protein [Chamaesiphon sp. OTE_75_metabat_556]|uniref:tetratricopeptide repeat protein n=1 Tax=Chamaesiphon sp. OTE_75_metabat_556 TaxID=2964692 RepID=UPI00286BD701|nr:tetratricopeptide repeat protein [Chamaesiphon sp. OTE_75_metabat_556]
MQSGHLLRNRYRIENRLSAGGFGETYIAIDEDYPDKRRVVVKHLKPQNTNPGVLEFARRLFENEGVTLAKLGEKTDLIPTLYAYFEEDREFYLVQEFIEGQTLTQELGTRRLSESETIAIVRKILVVLTEVHRQRIVHRDLKPDNIIRRSRDRQLVLIDFGAIKEVRHTNLQISNAPIAKSIRIGTTGYMPSEQAMGYPTAASDIYAVGAIALQCLTGKLPSELFDEDALEFKWQHLCVVSDRWADLLAKMVAPRQIDRYPNAMESIVAIDLLAQTVMPTANPVASTIIMPVPKGAKVAAQTPSPTYIPPVSANSSSANIQAPPQPQQALANKQIDQSKLLKWAVPIGAGLVSLFLLSRLFTPPTPKTASIQPKKVSSTLPAATPKAVSKEDRASLAKYNQTIEINPKDANAYVDRGVLKVSKLNDTSGALADCDQAIQIDPNHAKAYLVRGILKADKLNDTKGGLGDYNRAIQINPDYDAAYFVRGALKTEKLNDTQGALGDYNRAIKINSDYANAYVNRGFLKTNKLNDGQGALADYNRAIKIDPKHTNAYRNRGILKEYKLNNTSAALADYNRAIQIDSNYADGYYNRGALKTNKLNDSQGALADFDQSIQLNPNFADFYIDRGALKTTKLNDTPGALADFDRAIQIDPKNANAYMNRGVIKYMKLNDLQGSLADYNRASELNPNNADTHNNLAFVKYDLGDPSGAIQSWRKALTLNTKDADAQLGLAVALYKQGQEAEAYTLGTIAIRAEKRSTDLAFLKKEKIWSENILKDAATFFQTPTMSAIR